MAILPIKIEFSLPPERAKTIFSLAVLYDLTIYDAAYLELAKRKGLALATLDDALIEAAPLVNVGLLK